MATIASNVVSPTDVKFSYLVSGRDIQFILEGEVVYKDELLMLPTDTQSLIQALSTHPSQAAWIGVLAADAKADETDAKKTLDLVEAELDATILEEFQDAHPNASRMPGEETRKKQAHAMPEFVGAMEDYLTAVRRALVMSALDDSFRTRGVMLATMAGIYREEFRSYHST